MTYDVAHRFAQALDPSALLTVTATLHAIEAARRDCRTAGVADEEDPAVLLLARHLGAVAAVNRPGDAALRSDCAAAVASLRRSPALRVLATRPFTADEQAKSTFHAEGRRALLRLADALGLERGRFDLRSCLGGPGVIGEVILHGEDAYVQLGHGLLGPERCVLFRRVRGRRDYTGATNHWATIGELLAPDRLADRMRRELELAQPARAAVALFA
jgi:hypothetical protein